MGDVFWALFHFEGIMKHESVQKKMPGFPIRFTHMQKIEWVRLVVYKLFQYTRGRETRLCARSIDDQVKSNSTCQKEKSHGTSRR